jgi:hypothetical protein
MHELRRILINHRSGDDNLACNNLMTVAEREFVMFTRAVTELFGPEESKLSARDWLDEVASMDYLPAPMSREWRFITVAALARLTIRMTLALQYPGTLATRINGKSSAIPPAAGWRS